MNHPQEELSVPVLAKRDLLVDVWNSQAHIVEMVVAGSEDGRIRRLREQRFTHAERMEAERLKRQIVYGENAGSYSLTGSYRPQSDGSAFALILLVAEVERRAGAEAWDRRRYPR